MVLKGVIVIKNHEISIKQNIGKYHANVFELKKKAFSTDAPKDSFHIVGIGCSAGEIKALELFFAALPTDTCMAFIIILNLDSSLWESNLPELIQRNTKMKVFQIEDGMKVQPNCVYVIPPDKKASINEGVLQLYETIRFKSMEMPIDFFLEHLAKDQQEKSICIIFSGIGTDGTLGLRAVKEKLGLVIVQDPDTVEYKSMLISAINTNIVDYIVPVEEMPAKLIGYVRHFVRNSDDKLVIKEYFNTLPKIFNLIRNQTGHDFSLYKKNTIIRRIERRINIHQFDTINSYEEYLKENPQEIDMLFNELLIGVTNFFREEEAFEYLKENVIPNLLRNRMKEQKLRVWIPGCSTGEEAYSIAIIIRECLENLKLVNTLKVFIFATDINSKAIEIARQGAYPANIAVDISRERLARFFIKIDDNCYQVRKEIREMVVFAPQSIIMDPPFIKLDMLCCRNLLIYFSTELQKKLMPIFHYSLNPGGILFLGSSETIGEYSNLFSVKENKFRIFERKEFIYSLTPVVDFLSQPVSRQNIKTHQLKKDFSTAIPDMVKRALIENFTPPAIVINYGGDIVYISGKTGNYLEPAPGKANLNIFAMAREGIKFELGKAIQKAAIHKTSVSANGLKVKLNGEFKCVNITVSPLDSEEYVSELLIVVFENVSSVINMVSSEVNFNLASEQAAVVTELEGQLMYKSEYLQSTIEEMETTQEELKSMNEELQLTNEELQSTNEELKTSREELQSLNEELLTVNSEMQMKNYNLTQSNNDMRNLLYSTQIATIFLDNNLNIKRFTPEITKIINLIQTDVGRPIGDIVQNLKYSNLISDVKEVLDTLVLKEVQLETIDKNWFNMRILPYRTVENIIDGVVITFNNITSNKNLEAALEEAKNFAWEIISTVREPLIVLDSELKVITANRSFYKTFGVNPKETEKKFIYELGNGQWNLPALKHLLEEILPENNEFDDFVVQHEFPTIGFKIMVINARIIYHDKHSPQMILLAFEEKPELDMIEK